MDFDKLNETDVREEILSPWLRELGYRSTSENNILREQSLRYPRFFLGRKNLSRDPLLRGKADYILEAGRRVRWVIEAKAPSCALEANDVEQAWTYANHPEVRAVYFCLCNGKQFVVYQTNAGPDVAPVLSMTHEELLDSTGWSRVVNLLSPAAVLRDWPHIELDNRPALGPNLRSLVRVTGGWINYGRSSLDVPAMTQLQASVIGGAIERDEAGRMVALIETRAPLRQIQAVVEKLGLTQFEMISEDTVLSTDPSRPSIFKFSGETTFPAGEEMLDVATWKSVVLPENIQATVSVTARAVLTGSRLSGAIENRTVFNSSIPASFEGGFELHLS